MVKATPLPKNIIGRAAACDVRGSMSAIRLALDSLERKDINTARKDLERAMRSLESAERLLNDDSAPIPDILAVCDRIDPAFQRSALITARQLRKALPNVSKEALDAECLRLAREFVIGLHRHDFASSLSDDEREELIVDERGQHYCGFSLMPQHCKY